MSNKSVNIKKVDDGYLLFIEGSGCVHFERKEVLMKLLDTYLEVI